MPVRLFEEIVSALGPDGEALFGGAKVVLYAGKCAYFENVKSVLSFSESAAVLRLKRGTVTAEGRGLSIARYGEGDLLLKGDVRCVRAEDAEDKKA